MKNFAIIFVLSVLVGCGDSVTDGTVTLQGDADLNLQDNLTECQIRQVGSNYLVQQVGLEPYSMAIDMSVTYPDKWMNLPEADGYRVAPLTQPEIDLL